ncbi:MAG: hypothetical protein ABIS14_08910 [Sphingomonas sp.]
MTAILTLLGTLIVTFWVSRALLAALRRTSLTARQQLLIGHAASLLLIGLFVFWVKVLNIFAPFTYIPGQLAWLALDWLRQMAVPKPPSSRRRRSSKARVNIDIPGWLVLAVMGSLTALYVGAGLVVFAKEAATYDNFFIGNSPQEVVYAVGKPAMARNSDAEQWQPIQGAQRSAQWLYTAPFMIISFSPEQTVQNVVCTNQDKVSQGACVPAMKVDIGDHEMTVLAKLGLPTNLFTTPDGKRIYRYPELGHDYVFEQFYVRSIRVYPMNGDTLGWCWRFLLWMLP